MGQGWNEMGSDRKRWDEMGRDENGLGWGEVGCGKVTSWGGGPKVGTRMAARDWEGSMLTSWPFGNTDNALIIGLLPKPKVNLRPPLVWTGISCRSQ